MHYAISAVRWHLNPEDDLSHPWLRNATSIISAAKWVIRTRVGLPIFVVWRARRLAEWAKVSRCMPFVVLREPTDQCFGLLLLPDQHHWCNGKVQTHCSVSKFTIYDEASTSQCGVTCAKASNKHEAEWRWVKCWRCRPSYKNMDCDPTFAGASSSNEPHLLTKWDLNDIVRDLNLSKKQAELLGSRLKGWNLQRQDTKVCFYRGRHEEFKDFFSQGDGVVFCNDVCSII